MGQTLSNSLRGNRPPTLVDGSNLSLSSKGALRDATCCQCADDLSSKSTATTEDSQPHQKTPSLEDAIHSANAFFAQGSGWSLHRSDQQQPKDGRGSNQRQRPRPVDIVVEHRSPSRPVPVKGALRRQESAHEDHFALRHEHDDPDAEYLKRLYEMRTWDMYVRITEARKRQKFGGTNGCVPEPPRMEQDQNLIEAPTVPTDVAPDHEMIFSCDLE